ncbi:MAG: hypothetical protein GY858_07525 [Candidatus Omnitrophica bacterium]|nr:hypothetical protein [Candidatus Omnitrophota bacterium]
MKTKIKRCKRCGLVETFPGVDFNNDQICNYCAYYDLYKERHNLIKAELKNKFSKIIHKTKQNKNKYDCIVAYSGGKDSTFLLNFLKTEFKLNILAHVLDNNFISPSAFKNIDKVTKALGVDCVTTKLDKQLSYDAFTYALKGKIPYPKEILALTSPVCGVCIGMVLGSTFNLAIKHKIPIMFIGFTPGQYPAISLENFLKVESCIFTSDKVHRDDPLDVLKILADPICEKFGDKASKYYFRSQYHHKGLKVPRVLFPFHAFLDYDEKEIIAEISKLGWERPKDTDPCSTNCLLNAVGNYASMKQLNYHPYIGELAHLVREGKITKAEALLSEKIDENSHPLEYSLKRLKLTKEMIGGSL